MRSRSALAAIALAAVVALAGCSAGAAPRATVLPTPGVTSVTGASAPATPPSAAPSPATSATSPGATSGPGSEQTGSEQTGSEQTGSEQTVLCTDGVASVSGTAGTYALSGACARVTVAGTGILLRTDGGAIDTLVIQGDDNTVSGASGVTQASVQGQGNAIQASSVEALTLRGQRNGVTSSGDITRLDIAGNDNTVAAPHVGTATVSGDGNVYPGS